MFAEYTQGKNIKVLPLVLSLVESTARALASGFCVANAYTRARVGQFLNCGHGH
jgi:hypothetical protein